MIFFFSHWLISRGVLFCPLSRFLCTPLALLPRVLMPNVFIITPMFRFAPVFLLFWSPCRFLFTESLPPTSHLSSAHLCAHLSALPLTSQTVSQTVHLLFSLTSPFFYCSSSLSQLHLTPSFLILLIVLIPTSLHFFLFILLTPPLLICLRLGQEQIQERNDRKSRKNNKDSRQRRHHIVSPPHLGSVMVMIVSSLLLLSEE